MNLIRYKSIYGIVKTCKKTGFIKRLNLNNKKQETFDRIKELKELQVSYFKLSSVFKWSKYLSARCLKQLYFLSKKKFVPLIRSKKDLFPRHLTDRTILTTFENINYFQGIFSDIQKIQLSSWNLRDQNANHDIWKI